MLVGGHDFFSSPRLSPDGRQLAWLAWDHPNMPWNGTTLYLAELDEAGAVAGEPLAIAGGPEESIFQPEWSPEGTHIFFVSDQSGWWNLYRFELATQRCARSRRWRRSSDSRNGLSACPPLPSPGPIASSALIPRQGSENWRYLIWRLKRCASLETPFTKFASVRANGDQVVFVAGAPSLPVSVVEFDLKSGQQRTLKKNDRDSRSHRPAHRRLSYHGRGRGISDHRREHRVRSFLSTSQSRLCRSRGRKPAAPRQVSWRPDGGRVERTQPRHPVLDKPRHCSTRRELWREHRVRSRLS